MFFFLILRQYQGRIKMMNKKKCLRSLTGDFTKGFTKVGLVVVVKNKGR